MKSERQMAYTSALTHRLSFRWLQHDRSDFVLTASADQCCPVTHAYFEARAHPESLLVADGGGDDGRLHGRPHGAIEGFLRYTASGSKGPRHNSMERKSHVLSSEQGELLLMAM
eukprot:CAMPEP_0179022654 /NCGR_PEP_ID=MMETSP0796-20121207/6522_1 /TAXON_ID=73915 /ORGANISM="Pyrodinium bahamense, Strain pbaha01" /LENGTH=113 /DNA_ID=CAMNT_0020718533 /DNA_START=10 /DNA_END=352 /DNA_ORIENTATION=-